MMGSFPFFRLPYPNYYYNSYRSRYPHLDRKSNTNSSSFGNNSKIVQNPEPFEMSENRKISSNLDEPLFEILGFSLYLDDIIILGLLFFLYTEGVQDEMLFICLILLLLS